MQIGETIPILAERFFIYAEEKSKYEFFRLALDCYGDCVVAWSK